MSSRSALEVLLAEASDNYQYLEVAEFIKSQGYLVAELPEVPKLLVTPSPLPHAVVAKEVMVTLIESLIQQNPTFWRGSPRDFRNALNSSALFSVSIETIVAFMKASFAAFREPLAAMQKEGYRADSDVTTKFLDRYQISLIKASEEAQHTIGTASTAERDSSGNWHSYSAPPLESRHTEALPFEAVLLCPNSRMPSAELQACDLFITNKMAPVMVLGWILTDGGTFELGILVDVKPGPGGSVTHRVSAYYGHVSGPERAVPISAMHLMDPLLRRSLFRQHKMSKVGPTVVRLAKKAARKSTVPIDFSSVPSSYYTLELPADAKAYLLHIRRSLAAERKLRYRHARAAHFRMKIRRGMLPMPFEENEWCTKNGYEIFGAGDLPANRATLLMARGYPQKRPDEWMALKVAFVQDTMVGSEDLPTRTAVRKIPDILHLTKP